MVKKIAVKGFTLIELMIVVAIIGLLAALAIPNFIKFQAKARQSEAKSNLKACFTAQKAYYGDKQTYYDVFSVIGFEPEMNNRYAYFGEQGATDNAGEIRTNTGVVHTPATSKVCAAGPQGNVAISPDEQKWTNNADPGYVAPAVNQMLQNTGSTVAALAAIGVFPAATCCAQGQCEFACGAVGNVDNDQTLDEWFIASQGTKAGGVNNTCQLGGPGTGTSGDAAEGEPVNICNDVNF